MATNTYTYKQWFAHCAYTVRSTALYLLCAIISASMFFPVFVSAEQYDVRARVPFEIPTIAAVIDPNLHGTTSRNAQQTITGTCQILDQDLVVSIWRDATILGSGLCLSGNFSVQVILAEGLNTLIAKTANEDGVYGPDSSSVTLALVLPPRPEPLPPTVMEPTTSEQKATAINAGGKSKLRITTDVPFGLLTADKEAELRIEITGGQSPYTLQIVWGDGSKQEYTVESEGIISYAHTYPNQQSYQVKLHVRDAAGGYSEYFYTVISGQRSKKGVTGNSSLSTPKKRSWAIMWLYGFMFLLLLLIIIVSYFLGWKHAAKQYNAKAKRVARKTAKPTRVAVAKKRKRKKRT